MFLNGKIELLLYRDAEQTEFPQKEVLNISEAFNETTAGNTQTLTLSLTASNSATVNFNSVGTAKYVYIYSDTTDINVNMNALGNLLFSAQIPSLLAASVGSMVITNASSTTATTVSIYIIAD